MAGCSGKADEAAGADAFFERRFADLQGVSAAMSDYRGKPVLVNFWATWCAPCVKEMPDLDALQSEFPQVAFVGIGIDSAANLSQFVQKIPVRYDLYEAQASGLELMRALGSNTGGLPYTVLIGADGRILQSFAGQISKEALRPQLRRMAAGT
ncbi:TlpA family protein disulfide reductase [Verticiella sediminum]|uniref:TlpA family protein disulfide reductase n=1 Tax=Verticiella sediminum TaxID=1247510 RepID=UPI002482A5A8|nr:TlpA disulfide reductase family protein [Verticiella sediminum]